MIADPTLRGDARKIIEHEHTSAEHAVLDVLEKLVSGWNSSPARTYRLGPPMSATSSRGS